MSATESRRRPLGTGLYILIVLVLGTLFALFVVQFLGAPIIGSGDESIHSYQSYYLQQYLHFVPWPKLDLDNNALLYPYGTDQVFQSWVFERDLFGMACLRLFGPGPWVQIHFLFNVTITAVGIFLLLRREHSWGRSAFAGLAVGFCNFYPICKFPGHANIAVVHWSMISVAADYVIMRRLWRGETPSARLLLLRAALVFLSLGQEMGYVAGLSLTSFVLTFGWGTLVVLSRGRALTRAEWLGRAREHIVAAARDLRLHPGQSLLFALALAWGAFFYFPLVLQVFLHTKKFPLAQIASGVWWQWANPLRLFIPIVPGLEPISTPGGFERVINYLHDEPEGFFAMSPGLFFVLIALLGVFLAIRKKTFGALVPVLVLWLLVVANHPGNVPTLRAFPWFAYARTTAKLGNVNCVALVLLAVGGIPAGYFSGPGTGRRVRQVLFAGLALLFATEVFTAYRIRLLYRRDYFVAGKEFYGFMDTISRSPGEAVLEWPFCVASGTGFGTLELGPYFRREASLFALSEFHHKKVPSGYYGRVFPQQLTEMFHVGWPGMFFPDHPNLDTATRQSHDFTPNEWEFFEQFFRKNDFCGILLCPEFLPGETVRGMHERFGPPTAVMEKGVFGRMEFIARPAAWGRPANAKEGKMVAYSVPLSLPVTHIDFTNASAVDYLREGWSSTENSPRFSEARQASVVFGAPAGMTPRTLTMDLHAGTFEAQRFTLRFNGRVVKTWQSAGRDLRHYMAELPADAWRAGANDLTFELPQAHRPPPVNKGENEDARDLGLLVESLELKEASAPQ